MEFGHVGAHCALSGCHQQDFLPFTCESCKLDFCLAHRLADQHACSVATASKRKVILCSHCQCSIQMTAAEDEDMVLAVHISLHCAPQAKAKQKARAIARKTRCSVKACGRIEALPIRCSVCKQYTCVPHRLPQDHGCKADSNFTPTKKQHATKKRHGGRTDKLPKNSNSSRCKGSSFSSSSSSSPRASNRGSPPRVKGRPIGESPMSARAKQKRRRLSAQANRDNQIQEYREAQRQRLQRRPQPRPETQTQEAPSEDVTPQEASMCSIS